MATELHSMNSRKHPPKYEFTGSKPYKVVEVSKEDLATAFEKAKKSNKQGNSALTSPETRDRFGNRV